VEESQHQGKETPYGVNTGETEKAQVSAESLENVQRKKNLREGLSQPIISTINGKRKEKGNKNTADKGVRGVRK